MDIPSQGNCSTSTSPPRRSVPPVVVDPNHPALKSAEVQFARLVDLLFGDRKLESVCYKGLLFLCEHFGASVGGVYLNLSQNMKDWILCAVYPGLEELTSRFDFNAEFRLILQASVQRHSFLTRNSKSGTALVFVPLVSDKENGSTLGVIVLVVNCQERDRKAAVMQYLEQIGKLVASSISSIMLERENASMRQKLEQVAKEKDQYHTYMNLIANNANFYDEMMQA
jgi:GAF domain-containing protein